MKFFFLAVRRPQSSLELLVNKQSFYGALRDARLRRVHTSFHLPHGYEHVPEMLRQAVPQVPATSSSAWNPLLKSFISETVQPKVERWKSGLDALLVFVEYPLFKCDV
jgi:hypothetical protein